VVAAAVADGRVADECRGDVPLGVAEAGRGDGMGGVTDGDVGRR
jgi:hypothetical protein